MCKLQGKHVRAITCKILKKADTFTVEEAWPSGLRRELRCGEARVRISEQAEVFLRDGGGEMVAETEKGEIMKGRSLFF